MSYLYIDNTNNGYIGIGVVIGLLFAAVGIVGTPQALAKKVSPYDDSCPKGHIATFCGEEPKFRACELLLPNPCYPPHQRP
jgi:hypothetical protein